MIELKIIREQFLPDRTIGKLYNGEKFICYTLEDKVRPDGQKIPGKTAIPAGNYSVVVTRSNRFSQMTGKDVYLPEILRVPGFEGVRIHAGNTPADTEGCVLVGKNVSSDKRLVNSKIALLEVMEIFKSGGYAYVSVFNDTKTAVA